MLKFNDVMKQYMKNKWFTKSEPIADADFRPPEELINIS